MTLRAIEIVESCLNFFASVTKTIRQSRMFALRVTLMTLRAIEIVESCLNFFASVTKTIRQSRMFAPRASQTRCAILQILGIPRIRNIASLSLQRTSNAQHPSR